MTVQVRKTRTGVVMVLLPPALNLTSTCPASILSRIAACHSLNWESILWMEGRWSTTARKMSCQTHHSQQILSVLWIHGKRTGCSSDDASSWAVLQTLSGAVPYLCQCWYQTPVRNTGLALGIEMWRKCQICQTAVMGLLKM